LAAPLLVEGVANLHRQRLYLPRRGQATVTVGLAAEGGRYQQMALAEVQVVTLLANPAFHCRQIRQNYTDDD